MLRKWFGRLDRGGEGGGEASGEDEDCGVGEEWRDFFRLEEDCAF